MRRAAATVIAWAPAALSILAGVIATVASATLNVSYGLASGAEPISRGVWAALAIVASIGTALSLPALAASLARLDLARAMVACLGLLLCGGFSFACALGAAHGSRADLAASSDASAGTRARAQAAYARSSAELAATAPARHAAEVQADIDRLTGIIGTADCATWQPNRIRQACADRQTARIELARATDRARLAQEIAAAKAALDHLPPDRAVNADAVALAALSTALGAPVKADTIALWLTLLRVALAELAGGILFGIASALAPRRASTSHGSHRLPAPTPQKIARGGTSVAQAEVPTIASLAVRPISALPAPVELPHSLAHASAEIAADVSTVAVRGGHAASNSAHTGQHSENTGNDRLGAPALGSPSHSLPKVCVLPMQPVPAKDRSDAAARLFATIRAQGGTVAGSVRGMATAIGTTPALVRAATDELVAAGKLAVDTSRSGTIYRALGEASVAA